MINPLNLYKYLPYLLRKRFNKKYIIIESDDWGMSQNTSYSGIEFLEKKFGREKFTRWTTDSLETCEDLNLLFGILNKYKTSYIYIPKDRSQKFSNAMQIYFEKENKTWLFKISF